MTHSQEPVGQAGPPQGGDDVGRRIRVAAVDDHPVVLFGLRACLAEMAPDVEWVGVAPDVDGLLPKVLAAPTVVLLDIRLRDGSELEANVSRLGDAGARVLLFTSEHRPVVVRRGLEAGALGLVLKEDPEQQLVEAIRAAHAGEAYVSSRLAHQIVNDPRGRVRLTDKQRAVLELMARGMTPSQIGSRLYMTAGTVATHRKRAIVAFAKQEANSLEDTTQLAWRAVVDGHVEIEPDPPRC